MQHSPNLDLLLSFLAVNRALSDEWREVRRLFKQRDAETKYNPNWRLQPRAPKGTAEGGQWVDGGANSSPKVRRPPRDHNQPPQQSLQEVFPALSSAPASAILAPVDGFLGITGPGQAASEAAMRNLSAALIREIRALDPSYRPPALAEPGGFPATIAGRNNYIDNLRADRAVAIYRLQGDVGPLQVETLRFVQQRVDIAYAQALRLYSQGRLSPRLSREEAIGNHIDGQVRAQLREFYSQRGVSTNDPSVRVNRRDYDHSRGDRAYRIPDSRVGGVSFDWTLTRKTPQDPQIRGFFNADSRPTAVVVVRPTQLGRDSTYLITRPRE